MALETMSENYAMKIEPVASICSSHGIINGIIDNQHVRNEVISYSFRGFDAFLNVPEIIIVKFGENIALGQIYIDIIMCINFGGGHVVYLKFLVYYS